MEINFDSYSDLEAEQSSEHHEAEWENADEHRRGNGEERQSAGFGFADDFDQT